MLGPILVVRFSVDSIVVLRFYGWYVTVRA